MGYRVKKLPGNKKRAWKLQVQAATNTYDIAPNDLGSHGFTPSMTYEEAQARASALNKQAEIKRHAVRKVAISKRLESELLAFSSSFPDEQEFLSWLVDNQRFASIKENKSRSHWHNAKRLISQLSLKPTEYAERCQAIYKTFAEQKLSLSYVIKILRLLNLYGRFYGRKYKVYVEPLSAPKGYDKSDIEDAYFNKNPEGKAAKPLTPILLASAKRHLKASQYNWLYVSFWCGLRPSEVDALKTPSSYRVEHQKEVAVLWVYQAKLRRLAREDRWKPIPLVEPEQKTILALIKAGAIERPLAKTLQRHLGQGVGCYSGRKGFEAVMRDRGHSLENVSQWLGHQSIERTWKNYVNKKVVRWGRS